MSIEAKAAPERILRVIVEMLNELEYTITQY
jgi:hypothetical protein